MAHNIPPIKLLGGYIPSIPPVVDAPDGSAQRGRSVIYVICLD